MTDHLTFAAIDVETANRKRGSVCAIGVTLVDGGVVESTQSWLCRPPAAAPNFDPWNTRIHGITADDVVAAEPFSTRIEQVVELIGTRPVLAHNASFDIGAVRMGCEMSDLAAPEWKFGCTLSWSRSLLDLISYRLPIVAEALGIAPGAYHAAGDDSATAARIAIELARRAGASTVEDLADAAGGLLRSSGQVRRSSGPRGLHRLTLPDAPTVADPDHPLFGQVIVFTGGLATMTRQDAWDMVVPFGASPEKGVTKRTTRLVIGDGFTGRSAEEFQSAKAKKAVTWRDKGHLIEVLTETDFIELLSS